MSWHEQHIIWFGWTWDPGLDPDCLPLEIATIVTSSELDILAERPSLVIHQPDEVLDAMDAWNTEHHGKSGLIQAVKQSRVSCAEAESMTLAFLEQWTEPGRSPLCGNSIGQDRRFLRRYMPALNQHLHYRVIDISSIKELAWRWYKLQYRGRRKPIARSVTFTSPSRASLLQADHLLGDGLHGATSGLGLSERSRDRLDASPALACPTTTPFLEHGVARAVKVIALRVIQGEVKPPALFSHQSTPRQARDRQDVPKLDAVGVSTYFQ